MLLRKIVFSCFVERQRWIMMWTKKHPVEQKLGRMLFVWMGLIRYFITTPWLQITIPL